MVGSSPLRPVWAAHLKQRERRHRVPFGALRAFIPHADFELDFDLASTAGEHVDAGAECALFVCGMEGWGGEEVEKTTHIRAHTYKESKGKERKVN